MKYSAAVLALASGALAHSGGWVAWPTNGTRVAVETIVTTAYTTYCPEATEVVQNGKTYTVTEATTLTITDCPCTFTRPIATPSTVLYTSCPPTSSGEEATATSPAQIPANNAPVYVNPLAVSYTATVKPTGTGSYTVKPAAAQYTGAASANKIGSFIVGAVAGVAALAL